MTVEIQEKKWAPEQRLAPRGSGIPRLFDRHLQLTLDRIRLEIRLDKTGKHQLRSISAYHNNLLYTVFSQHCIQQMNPNMSDNWNLNNNHNGTPINSINNFSTTQPNTFPSILPTGGSSYAPYFSSGPTTPNLNVSSSSSSRTNYPSTYTYSSLHRDPAPWTTSSGSSSHNQHSGGRPSNNGWVDRHARSAHNNITAAGTGNGAGTTKGVSEGTPQFFSILSIIPRHPIPLLLVSILLIIPNQTPALIAQMLTG